MKKCKGIVSSIYNGTAVDGPGIRSIVFMAGCNMRCPYCHNPETFEGQKGKEYTTEELCKYILRYKNYIKSGGVTFSGGEPFLQAEFCAECAEIFNKHNISVAVETNCSIIDKKLISVCKYIIADIKNINGINEKTIEFLEACAELKTDVIMTNVLIKDVNDGKEKLNELKKLKNRYNNITAFRFLPFKKLCLDKYNKLGINFPYKDLEETTEEYIKEVGYIFDKI